MDMNEEAIRTEDDEIEIDIGAIFRALFQNVLGIVLAMLAVGLIFYCVAAFLITPKYKSAVKMYVNNKADSTGSVSSSDISASQSLVDTYAVILKSYPTMSEVLETTGVDYTYEQLTGMVSVAAINSTEVFSVTVTSTDPEEAALIANAIAEIAPDELMEQVEGSSVKVVEYARVATSASSPNVMKYTLVGFLLGFLISCAVVVIREILSANTLSVEEKLKQNYDTPVLSIIPDLVRESHSGKKKKKGVPTDDSELLCDQLDFAGAEAYKLLRTNLSFCIAGDEKCRVIGVTSSTKGEGKSTLAINLAYTLAQTGQKVCLLDSDMRLPSVAKKLGLNSHPGLSNLLSGQVTNSDVLLQKYVTDRSTFYVMTSGDVPPNPAELLESARMESILATLKKTFDYIILDMPPVTAVSDALIAARLVQGMLFTVREDMYDRKMISDAMGQLRNVKAYILGFVITDSSAQQKEYRKKGYGAYGYGYGETAQAD